MLGINSITSKNKTEFSYRKSFSDMSKFLLIKIPSFFKIGVKQNKGLGIFFFFKHYTGLQIMGLYLLLKSYGSFPE